METTVYRAARLAYRLGRQDQQRILEVRLRKHFDSDVQAKQLRDLAEGMTDELVDFHAIVRAAEEDSTSPEAVNTAEPVNSRIPRSEVALRERLTTALEADKAVVTLCGARVIVGDSEGEERCDNPWPCPMHGGVAR